MIARLDESDPLGVDLTLRGASSRGKSTARRMTLYDYAVTVKARHPRKISLIRVGDFYECLGYDAVMLVLFAGLNPMGISGVPRAGCPVVKIQETLDRLDVEGLLRGVRRGSRDDKVRPTDATEGSIHRRHRDARESELREGRGVDGRRRGLWRWMRTAGGRFGERRSGDTQW